MRWGWVGVGAEKHIHEQARNTQARAGTSRHEQARAGTSRQGITLRAHARERERENARESVSLRLHRHLSDNVVLDCTGT